MSGRRRETDPEDVLAAFRDAQSHPFEPLTADEIDARTACSKRTTHRRLEELVDDGRLESKEVGSRAKVWFLPVDTPGARGASDADAELGDEGVDPERRGAPQDATDAIAAEPDEHPPGGDEAPGDERAAVEDVADEFPATVDPEEGIDAVLAVRDHLEADGPATMREIVAEVHPDHPLGYDVDAALETVEAGGRYRGAWWRRVVKPGLEALDDVQKPPQGASEWRYVGTGE